MENKKLLPISIIILAISIVFGAIWIGKSLERVAADTQIGNSNVSDERVLLTEVDKVTITRSKAPPGGLALGSDSGTSQIWAR